MSVSSPSQTAATARRGLFDHEHDLFRESFGRFLEAEIGPRYDEWERQGWIPRELFREAGAHGFLGMAIPERLGGAGADDFRFNAVVGEEAYLAGLTGVASGLTLHNDVCLPYFLSHATEEQRERWLPGLASGELIAAIAMTEPGTGSDLAAISTRAVRGPDGFTVDGAKTFITNGLNSDLVITVVRTDPADPHGGLSLLVLERGMAGFERGRNLDKIGVHSQDTAELFFDQVPVPEENLLGEEGGGFRYLTANLPQERLGIAVAAVAAARGALQRTLEYVGERRAFGRRIGDFQHSRFTLAECHREVEVAQTFVDRCIARLIDRELTPEDAAIAKWHCTEMQGRVVDRCLQLFGGYGYMTEYPISRAYVDARVTRIYGGTNEIMKEIVGRALAARWTPGASQDGRHARV